MAAKSSAANVTAAASSGSLRMGGANGNSSRSEIETVPTLTRFEPGAPTLEAPRVLWKAVILAALSTDPAAGVGIFAALAAGVVSFLSPCVLPLVPGYLSAVTGGSAHEPGDADWRRGPRPPPPFLAPLSGGFFLRCACAARPAPARPGN